MARRRGKSWAPVVVPLIVVVATVLLAFLIASGVWMTALLVVGLIALAFALISLFSRIP
jgi:hypothetical protein